MESWKSSVLSSLWVNCCGTVQYESDGDGILRLCILIGSDEQNNCCGRGWEIRFAGDYLLIDEFQLIN